MTSAQQIQGLLSFYVETQMHVGGIETPDGQGFAIYRDQLTNFPAIPAQAVRGALHTELKRRGEDDGTLATLFGSENDAGALIVGEGRILLFPVRTNRGLFAWVTCGEVIEHFRRECRDAGVAFSLPLAEAAAGKALTSPHCGCGAQERVVLEEYAFPTRRDDRLAQLGKWIADQLFPKEESHQWWRRKAERDIVILAQDDFHDLVGLATEVIGRMRLDPLTKNLQRGERGPHFEEYLPGETLFYSSFRAPGLNSEQIAKPLAHLEGTTVQIGAGETVGKGFCRVRTCRGEGC